AGLVAAAIVQLVVHEFGHLLGGWLSGYRFVSIRFGSLIWVRASGKVRLRRLHFGGLSGQCLMAPPGAADGGEGHRMPHFLYNLSGPAVNLALGAVSGGLALAAADRGLGELFFAQMALVGVMIGLLNGLPVSPGLVPNDGRNERLMAAAGAPGQASRRAVRITVAITERAAEGTRLRDLPAEWFAVRAPEGDGNYLVGSLRTAACGRLMDKLKFAEADQAITELLESGAALAGAHRLRLTVDLVFCELVGQNRPDVVGRLMTKPTRDFMKALRRQPSVLRTDYALARLSRHDPAAASRIRAEFDRIAKAYPYPGDIAGERELMAHVDGIVA
ncbi:MAG: M50 family metallopeptidase, partial [Bifidobacteriaceae bacterium]|nr:M50 family metallopeptidase [Bifidobacteriaceae bacterium]